MKADRYLIFSSAMDCQKFLDQLHTEMQEPDIWAEPNEHPFEDQAIIPWNDDYLKNYKHLLQGIEEITFEVAQARGFIFGRLKGPFAHARAKLEEAQLLQAALTEATPLPNFPVYRALFFGFLSATYAIKEALRKSCKRRGSATDAWFEVQFQRIQSDPLVWAFYQINNSNKHHSDQLPLRSYLNKVGSLRVSGGPNNARVVISHEGVIAILNEGTASERVAAINGTADVDWQVVLDMPEVGVVGAATAMSEHVLSFYEQLVFQARKTHGGEVNLKE